MINGYKQKQCVFFNFCSRFPSQIDPSPTPCSPEFPPPCPPCSTCLPPLRLKPKKKLTTLQIKVLPRWACGTNRGGRLCTCSKIKFTLWKLRLCRVSNSRNTRNFPYSLLCQSLSIPDILYYYFNIFPFQTSFDILPTLPPTLKQTHVGWLMMWSTLHISLYLKALCNSDNNK